MKRSLVVSWFALLLVSTGLGACAQKTANQRKAAAHPPSPGEAAQAAAARPKPLPPGKIVYRELSGKALDVIPKHSDQIVRLGYEIRTGSDENIALRLEDRGQTIINASSWLKGNRARKLLLSITRRSAKVILSEFEDVVGLQAKPILARLNREIPGLMLRDRGRFWTTLGVGVFSGGIHTRMMPGPRLGGHSGGMAVQGTWPKGKRLYLRYWLWSDTAHREANVSLGAGFLKVTHRGKPVDVKGWKWPLWSLYLDTPPR